MGRGQKGSCLLGRCIIRSLDAFFNEQGIVIFQKIREVPFRFIVYSNSRIPQYSCYEMCNIQRITRIDKNDILRQYNDKIIMYSDRFRYHLIISET